MKHTNDRTPNFYSDNKFYLVRCYACDLNGRENYAPTVASGECVWCGWTIENDKYEKPKGKTRWNVLEM